MTNNLRNARKVVNVSPKEAKAFKKRSSKIARQNAKAEISGGRLRRLPTNYDLS